MKYRRGNRLSLVHTSYFFFVGFFSVFFVGGFFVYYLLRFFVFLLERREKLLVYEVIDLLANQWLIDLGVIVNKACGFNGRSVDT